MDELTIEHLTDLREAVNRRLQLLEEADPRPLSRAAEEKQRRERSLKECRQKIDDAILKIEAPQI